MNLSVKDVARLLSVTDKTIYRWINQGTIPAYKIGDQFRFNCAELLEWATAQKIQISPEIFHEVDGAGTLLPNLFDALKAGGVHYRIGGTDKPSVLRCVVETMNLPEEVDREFLYQVMLARESLGSTGIGDGLAIPHVRNPIVLHLPRPMVMLCFLEHPIDFGAMDGQPVSTLFTLISPTIRAHLHLLSKLAFVLREQAIKDALKRQAARDELFDAVRRAESVLVTPGSTNPQPTHA